MNTDDRLRILVADDEPTTLSLYQEVLLAKQRQPRTADDEDSPDGLPGYNETEARPPSFELILCRDGEEVLRAVERSIREGRAIAVAFLDIHFSHEPDGISTAERVRGLDQHIEIVLMTGYDDIYLSDITRRVPPAHKLLYAEKPLQTNEIYQLASSLALKWQTEREFQTVHQQVEQWLEERTAELLITNEHLAEEVEERKRVEEALRKSEEQHRIVLESVPDPVVVYDPSRTVTYLNPAFTRVFEWTLDELKGRELNFVPLEYLPESHLIFQKIARGETLSGIESYRLTKSEQKVEVSLSGAGFFNSRGKLQGSVITIQDITERKKSEQEIKFIAYHDALTGLHNRKSFYMRLEDSILQSQSRAGSKRRSAARKWALLFLDLDRFKYINDTLGHDIGDALLTLVANRLQQCIRKSDYIFRLGGDEFTIILNDLANDTDVIKVARKIGENIAQPCLLKKHEIYISASIGISMYPDDGDDVERLVKNADMAMYAAKEGQQGYRFFTEEMNRKALERMILESHLRNALQRDQLIIYYQPLVNDRQELIGTEALLRWRHPELGMISPDRFIPLAEETGAIIPIGKWVLFSACRQAMNWHQGGHTDFYVAVNLSARQFREPDLVETIEQTLDVTGLPPHCLKLEVTEGGIMNHPEQAVEKMQLLREKGVHFSIDDFGTGYSSLSYLKRFPIDTLKIDRSFVNDSVTNKDDQEIIKTIIAMAKSLNLETVAEGVETIEQQEFLSTQGCHMMQGYYFGRPMPADRFEELLGGGPLTHSAPSSERLLRSSS